MHPISHLRHAALTRNTNPIYTLYKSGGMYGGRCLRCRLIPSHCICYCTPRVATHAGFCFLMTDLETTKPSNTGWLVADLCADVFAFSWARTSVDDALLALLNSDAWQPYVVFPSDKVDPSRVVTRVVEKSHVDVARERKMTEHTPSHQRPLFILLDATWSEAAKIFRKSPYLSQLPVLSISPEEASRYRLRRSRIDFHLCTAEVAALCLQLSGDALAAEILTAYLDVFSEHYLRAKQQQKINRESDLHQRLYDLRVQAGLPSVSDALPQLTADQSTW